MGLFTARQPRKFRRVSIYTDERTDKLRKLVDDVKREQGELPPEPYDPTKFRGKFSEYTPHARDRRNLPWPLALIAIILLAMLWYFLMTGHVY